ncbi:hypothetical protein Sjap_018043 [Stephania japonica]|uniref:PPPDE domain-containing protein n=1 Tax=Stephania japonica TaxID=461633 RepID=A0AAP0I7F9_9MAGN
MKEFCDIQSQIIQLHEALRGSVVDEQIVDDKDLTTKRLREIKLVLQGLQREKRNSYLHLLVFSRVHGVEYEFGGHDSPSTSIFKGKPRECPGLTFRKSILIGRTDLGPHEVHKFMEELSKSYTGTSYNLITKNCSHFCNTIASARVNAQASCTHSVKRPSPRSPQQEQRTIEDIEKDMISD